MTQVSRRPWGTHQGKDIYLFSIVNSAMRVTVANYGALLQSFFIEDTSGKPSDIVLGYDSLGEYLSDPFFFGAMIGPIADRIENGKFTLSNQSVVLPLNAGPDTMHSGPCGFHSQVWDWMMLSDGVVFKRSFSERALGFPGKLQVKLTYRIAQQNTLRLEYEAECSKETALSFTNHSYFNLDNAKQDCRNHILTVFADTYAETFRNHDPLVTGRFVNVHNTPFDFRKGEQVENAITQIENREIRSSNGVDHYFPVNGTGFRNAAMLLSIQSGLRLTCRTDAEGILIYTGNGITQIPGKLGKVYGPNWGVCMETGRLPNAVNLDEHRRQVILHPSEVYRSATEFLVEKM